MRAFDVLVGNKMTSYFAFRSPVKSCAFTISCGMPYCSSIHIIQPPGMLLAPFHKPTFVFGLSRKPSTAGTRSTPATGMPSVFAALSTIF